MSKICPQTNKKVLYLDCVECEDKYNCDKQETTTSSPLFATGLISYIKSKYPDCDENSIYVCEDGITAMFKTKTSPDRLKTVYYNLNTNTFEGT